MKFAAFTFATQNLGDDVQALAAYLFSRRLDALIDRDNLADAPLEETHACVFNSWFLVGNDFRPPSPLIDPILHSVCIGRDHLMKTPWREYLAANGPVGARDQVTQELLEGHGIGTYWSGCLTTFMGERIKPIPERCGVLFVDIDQETEARFVPAEVSARAERLTNFIPGAAISDPLRRLSLCVALIDRLAHAELVVTRRLHVALPCVGLGTPVCVLPDPAIANARRRFAGYDWLPIRFKDEAPGGLQFDWTRPTAVEPPVSMRAAHSRFQEAMTSRGLLSQQLVDSRTSIASSFSLTDDLPARAGRAFLAFGRERRELQISAWSSAGVTVETPPLPLVHRLAARIEVVDANDQLVLTRPVSDSLA